jgi:hypothetical protein
MSARIKVGGSARFTIDRLQTGQKTEFRIWRMLCLCNPYMEFTKPFFRFIVVGPVCLIGMGVFLSSCDRSSIQGPDTARDSTGVKKADVCDFDGDFFRYKNDGDSLSYTLLMEFGRQFSSASENRIIGVRKVKLIGISSDQIKYEVTDSGNSLTLIRIEPIFDSSSHFVRVDRIYDSIPYFVKENVLLNRAEIKYRFPYHPDYFGHFGCVAPFDTTFGSTAIGQIETEIHDTLEMDSDTLYSKSSSQIGYKISTYNNSVFGKDKGLVNAQYSVGGMFASTSTKLDRIWSDK